MASNLGHIAATASLNIDPFQQSTRVLQTQIRSLDSALKAQELSFKNNGKGISGLKTVYDQTGRSVTSYSALLETQKKKYNDLKEEIGDVSKASDDQKTKLLSAESAMNKTAGQVDSLTGKYNSLGKEIAIQESSWTKVGNSLDVIGTKAKKVGDNLTSFGSSMTKGVTLPIIGGVALAVKSAIDFESAFAGVKKTVDEVVDTNGNVLISYEDLSAGIREMSKELPASASEIATVAESAGQLGIQTENVLAFSKTMIDMGESTNLGATDAANALARFANITGMSQDKFTNLGSSIVELGNNYATTEAEIVNMSLRLAGAGSQIGLSEADILGLSAALSSVGIESEAGGSAFSKVMVEMQLAATKGGDELENFASIAGMSASEFKTAFETDAVGAIASFVQGLGNAEEKGTTAIELLDNMGISEVRLRDSLLRAGNASDLFTDAIKTSNDAFGENTALTDEANKRYETTESKLKMLRNQVTDVAIEFGGPFVDALSEGLVAAEPLIETLGDLASKFSEASPETQQMIVKTIALTAAIGPVSSLLGNVAKIGGGTTKVIAGLSKTFGIISGTATASASALGATTTTTGALSAGMVGATGSSAGLVAGLGAIAPALLIVGGAVALGTIAWKTWGEDALEASQRTQKWGSDIGEEADKALNEFQKMSDEAGLATDLMAFNIEEGTTRAVDAYSGMAGKIKEDIQETIAETQEGLAGLPESVKKIVAESMTVGVEEQTKLITEVDEIQAAITKVYENALAENRSVTEEELTVIENYHARLAEIRTETLNLSAEEQKNVQAVMTEDLKTFSAEQLRQRVEMLGKETTAIKDGYNEQAKFLEEQRTAGKIGRAEYNDAMAALNAAELSDLSDVGAEYIKVWEEQGTVPVEVQKKLLAEMGLNYDEIQARIDLANLEIEQSNKYMAESSADASEEVRKANDTWNGMILDEKTGKVKTNLDQVITEASESEEGWNNLQFIIQNAELDTNAKEKIQDALMANGQWWQMEFPTQFADVETNAGQTAQYYLQANYDWEGLLYEDKMAILNTNTPETLQQALIDTGVWENLTPTEKEMIMTTNAGAAAKQALIATGQWDSLTPEQKRMVVTSNSTEKALQGIQDATNWNGKEWKPKDILVETNAATVAGDAIREIGKVQGKTVFIKTVREQVDGYQSFQKSLLGGPRAAKGTNSHIGGKLWLGDGGKNEPWLTPQGDFGISPNDWTLYDLPKGTKVWPSIEKFNSEIPRFANGTDIADTRIMRTMSMLSNQTRNASNRQGPSNNIETVRESSSQTVVSQLIASQKAISNLLTNLLNSEGRPLNINLDGRNMASVLLPILDKQNGQLIYDTGEGVNI